MIELASSMEFELDFCLSLHYATAIDQMDELSMGILRHVPLGERMTALQQDVDSETRLGVGTLPFVVPVMRKVVEARNAFAHMRVASIDEGVTAWGIRRGEFKQRNYSAECLG